jgi:hypothetical protein
VWVAALRRNGGTRDQVNDVSAGFRGKPASYRILVKLTGSRWVQYDQYGDDAASKGWGGDYTLSGTRVRATETDSQYSGRITYDVDAPGDVLKIRVVSDEPADVPGCGPQDLAIQRMLYQTAAFHRSV